MDVRLRDLDRKSLSKLPQLSSNHFAVGEERVYLHCYNAKRMNWFLAEYGPIERKFFGFTEDRANGISSGICYLDDILAFDKRGRDWEVWVDCSWKPAKAVEVPLLQGYITLMRTLPDTY